MIEFKGELTELSKNYLLKSDKQVKKILTIVTFFVSLTITVILAETISRTLYVFITADLIASILFWHTNMKTVIKCSPKTITVEENKDIWKEAETGTTYYSYNDIKEIVDIGYAYHFKFYGKPAACFFLCQKDLITQGTIEEFEEIFADLIVRKID